MLFKLTSINDEMSHHTLESGSSVHTIQRHKEILIDYTNEFNKTRNNIAVRREREDLLGSVKKDIE